MTTGARDFDLSDFPNYLDGEVDILIEQPSLISLGVDLKNSLSRAGVGATLRGVEDIARDTIFLGLYADSPRAARYLAGSGIQLGEDLSTPDNARDFDLSDVPNYLDGEVDILIEQPSLISLGVDLKNSLSRAGVGATLRGVEDIARDTIFLGLYADSPRAARYLAGSGIQLGEDLSTPFTSNIELEGTSLILLNRSQDRDALVILADSTGSLKDAVKQLTSGKFRSGLVDDFVGVYKTNEAKK